MEELWSTEECRAYFGTTSIRSANRILSRMGVDAVAREPGRSGMNLYPADEVRRRAGERPGRGHRAEPQHENSTETTGTNGS